MTINDASIVGMCIAKHCVLEDLTAYLGVLPFLNDTFMVEYVNKYFSG